MLRTHTLRRHPTRAGAAVLVGATGLLLALQSPVAADPVTSNPAEAAAGWLATQLVDGDGDGQGDHIEITIDLNGNGQISDDERFPDYGLTADTIVALAAAGVGGDASTAATDYLEANVELYVGDADGVGDPDGEYYAGALAKTLLVADVTGRDPADFGGVDVSARLLSTETVSGRFSDISAFGDFSNNIGQAFAVLALARTAPGELSPEAAGFLVGQQCADGGALDGNVPLIIDADPCAASSVSIDTTSFAVQSYGAVEENAAARAGLEFLHRNQADDGGFSDMGVANANSTGLAAQALAVGGRDDAAAAARQWLLDRQLDCTAPPEQQGAIAFTDGPDGGPLFDDRAVRASAQAIPGLAQVGLLQVDADGSTALAPRLNCGGPTPTPTPTPTQTLTSSPTPTAPGPTTGPTPSQPGLPNTGADIAPLLGAGGVCLLLGVGLLAASRRRTGQHR